MVTQPPEAISGSGLVLSGTVPPLADAFCSRDQTGPDLLNALHVGETIALVHGEETKTAPAAQGGDCERYLGPHHQMTETVRENLDVANQA